MKTALRNITLKFITFLMVAVMAMFIVNKVIFLHVHKLSDGTIIVHAHPFNKANDTKPFKSHHHSNAEFLFFQNIETLFLVAFLTFTFFTIFKKEKFSSFIIKRQTLSCIILHKGRAPPIL